MKLSQPFPIKSKDPFWHFEYYSGCGNFFLIAFDPDNIHEKLSQEERAKLALLHQLVVDGVLFLGLKEDSLIMHYYNSDWSKAAMCGNGLRCLGHFAYHQIKNLPSSFSIQTEIGKRKIQILSDNTITTDMGPINPTYPLVIQKEILYLTDTGVPHALFVLPSLPEGPISTIARYYRFHEALGKEGANISFVSYSINEEGTTAFIRTYERGVERETGACGTGACAAAGILNSNFDCPFPFTINFESKEKALIFREANRFMLTASCENKGTFSLPTPLG
jgi:diaminopimelate epimerase